VAIEFERQLQVDSQSKCLVRGRQFKRRHECPWFRQ